MLRPTGAAKNPEVVKIFVSELVNSGLVEQPTLADPVYREGSPIFDFEITTKLRQRLTWCSVLARRRTKLPPRRRCRRSHGDACPAGAVGRRRAGAADGAEHAGPRHGAVAGAGQMMQFPSVAVPTAASGGVELSAKERRKQARDEKKAAAVAKREEKEIERRRKKNSKSRFSRAKYLREAEGNALSGVVLSSMLLVLTFIIPLLINGLFLIPATKDNQSVIQEVNTFRSMIDQARPILQAAVARKKERDDALTQKLAGFSPGDNAASALRRLISDLESRGAVMKTDDSGAVVNTDVGIQQLTAKTLTLELKADFLNYLLVRNRFVRSQPRINVAREDIIAAPGDPIVDVTLVLSIPAKS